MPEASRLGDKAKCEADSHGTPVCPNRVKGPATQGSPDVQINHMPALRLNDKGLHKSCAGPGVWQAVQGCESVLINYQPAVRKNDLTQHCGGVGVMIEGSDDVMVGTD